MKKLFKRNQIIFTIFAIMIAIAGYINYISTLDKDSVNANSDAINNQNIIDLESNDVDVDELSLMEPGTAVLTSGTISNSVVISEAKLSREQLRASNKEVLFQIIENESIEESAKQAAVDKMVEMTEISEKEMAAELLLEAKGYGDCVVTITEDNVDVVVNTGELTDVARVQIEDVVKRKTEVSADKIVISPINTLQ